MPNTEPEQPSSKIVHVAVAVIEKNQRFFVAKRPEHVHQGGLWEFPGGKVEAGESVLTALSRELYEELGIVLEDEHCAKAEPLITVQHDYGDKCVLLDVWRVPAYLGQPHGKEGQETQWVTAAELSKLNFPEANRPIVQACLLPPAIAITPPFERYDQLLACITFLKSKGAELIVIRQPQLDVQTYRHWVQQLLPQFSGITLALHGHPEHFTDLTFDHIHLPASVASRYQPPSEGSAFDLSVSCHNEQELLRADELGARFSFLSPVKPTPSHPTEPGMGWKPFKILCSKAKHPVYALGGLVLNDYDMAKAHGAQGIAAISAWLND